MKYKAVSKDQLIVQLGKICSPESNEITAYVIGPDINGRLCHIATCKGGIIEAQFRAEKLNSMKKLHFIAQLPDQSFVFYISFNDDIKDPYSGYFCQSTKQDPTIAELKPVALNEIKCFNSWLSDIDKATLNAIKLDLLGGDKLLKEVAKGCNYDVKLHGKNCYAYHLQLACEMQQHLKLI